MSAVETRLNHRSSPAVSRCAIAVLLLLTTACTSLGDLDADLDANTLTVLRSDPEDGVSGVFLARPIDIYFSAPLDDETISSDRLVMTSGRVRILGEISVDLIDQRLRFQPSDPLRPGISYTLHLSERVKGMNGAQLGTAFSTTFQTTTGAPTDLPQMSAPPPRVGSLQPIWTSRCVSACHEPPAPLAGVDLSTPDAVMATVRGIPAQGNPRYRRVRPGSHARSYLMFKVLGNRVGGGFRGAPMPPNGPVLTDPQLRRIAHWIDGGAR